MKNCLLETFSIEGEEDATGYPVWVLDLNVVSDDWKS